MDICTMIDKISNEVWYTINTHPALYLLYHKMYCGITIYVIKVGTITHSVTGQY